MWDLRNSVAPLKEFVGHTKVGSFSPVLGNCSLAQMGWHQQLSQQMATHAGRW
jgi:hypothetical protein